MKPTLTTKHLAAYLPYGVKCQVDNKIAELQAVYADGTCTFYDIVEAQQGFKSIKLCLRPLEDMTKQITINGKTFIPLLKVLKLHPNSANFKYLFCDLEHVKNHSIKSDLTESFIEHCNIELLRAWHFDTDNLIPQGLAINLNTLKQ